MSRRTISTFIRSVRQKNEWYFKITSVGQSETEDEWVKEAGIAPGKNVPAPSWAYPDRDLAYAALRELKEEAKRICFYDHSVHLSSRGLPPRGIDFASIEKEVDRQLNFMENAQFAIRAPSLQVHDPVGVFASDSLVPSSLQSELIKEMDRLAALEPKDFRVEDKGIPLSITKRRAQDLISPSLYPFVANFSRLSREPTTVHPEFETCMTRSNKHDTFFSSYSLVPSVFTVSPDGRDARIESYISGLGPRDSFPELYRLIELVFLLALPHLKKTVKSIMDWNGHWNVSPSMARWKEREELRLNGTTTSHWKSFLHKQREEKEKKKRDFDALQAEKDTEARRERSDPNFYLPSTGHHEPTCESRYSVIVKAVDYILDVEDGYSGEWHTEGMPHERIIASAIYYYDTDENISDEGLNLRRLRDPNEDFPTIHDMRNLDREDFTINLLNDEAKYENDAASDEDIITVPLGFLRFAIDNTKDGEVPDIREDVDCPSDWEGSFDTGFESDLTGTIAVGKVSTQPEKKSNGTGSILSLPNWLQHKVEWVGYSRIGTEHDTNRPIARRRILCFFLVDDSDLPEGIATYPGFSYGCGLPGPIPTTADLDSGSMPCLCNKPTLRFLLPFVCRQLISKSLPAELVELILEFVSFGVSREQAEAHRWEFKVERERYVDRLDDISQPIYEAPF